MRHIAKPCGACNDCCHPEPMWCDSWGEPGPRKALAIAKRDLRWRLRRLYGTPEPGYGRTVPS